MNPVIIPMMMNSGGGGYSGSLGWKFHVLIWTFILLVVVGLVYMLFDFNRTERDMRQSSAFGFYHLDAVSEWGEFSKTCMIESEEYECRAEFFRRWKKKDLKE